MYIKHFWPVITVICWLFLFFCTYHFIAPPGTAYLPNLSFCMQNSSRYTIDKAEERFYDTLKFDDLKISTTLHKARVMIMERSNFFNLKEPFYLSAITLNILKRSIYLIMSVNLPNPERIFICEQLFYLFI